MHAENAVGVLLCNEEALRSYAPDSITSLNAAPTPQNSDNNSSNNTVNTLSIVDSISVVSDTTNQPDSLPQLPHSLTPDSTQTPQKENAPERKDMLEARVEYQARDSIVFLFDGTGFLYGDGEVQYQLADPIKLTAEMIKFKLDSSTIYATGGVDSTGQIVGNPVFAQGSDSYSSKYMSYNFKTRKGFVRGVVTQQDEGYIVADRTKMFQGDSSYLYMAGGKYTTCNDHEHPHFYLQITKAKMQPGKYLAAGPAYLVMADVPLPIAVPFAYFPITNKYASGIIMPTFGEELSRGLFLKNGGYYWAINDYVDLEVLGEIFSKGTWGVNVASNYAWRYKFRGSFSLTYREDVTGIKGTDNYNKAKNFRISWRHQQDQKASQYSTLSASVDYSTSGYNTSNINNYYNPAEQSKNITSSSINYTQRFPDSQWSISLNASLQQRTQDSTISFTLPSLTVNLNQIYPFKRKNPVGKERWYEKIRLSYNMTFSNSITTKENMLFKSSFVRDWKNAVKHTLPISASFMLFKYLNFTISENYTERWYFNRINRDWDIASQKEVMDTTYGFYRVYDFSTSASLSTKLYGYFIPSRKLFGDHVDRFRHVLTPTVSFSYHPDFGSPLFKFYKSYTKTIVDKNSVNPISEQEVVYSPYSSGMYGVPGRGAVTSLNFSLQNNIEVKVKDKNDSTGQAYKKISLIDNLTINWGYNFAADSMNWNNLGLSIRLKLTKSFSLNLRGDFDPYRYVMLDNGSIVRSNQLRWDYGQGLWFKGTSTSFSYTFNNDTFRKKENKKGTQEQDQAAIDDPLNVNASHQNFPFDNESEEHNHSDSDLEIDDGYKKFEIPWSLTLSYSMSLSENRTKEYFSEKHNAYKLRFSHNLTFNGNIQPSNKWRVSFSGSVNLTELKVTQTSLSVTRDLHCWTLSASISPFGLYKSFMVTIGVNASMLRDIKYEKRSDSSTRINWLD